MKILIVVGESLIPTNSGGKVFKTQIIKSLAKNNDVFLYSFIKKSDQEENVECCKKCFFDKRNTFASMLRAVFLPFSVALRTSRKSEECIKKICHDYNIDTIIYVQSFVARAGHSVKCKKILVSENVEFASMKTMADASKNIIKKLIFKIDAKRLFRFEKKLYNGYLFDGYTFISPNDKETYETSFVIKKPMFYLKPGIVDHFEEKVQSNPNCFLFIGAQDYVPNSYGADWLASKVMPIVLEKNKNIKLYIVGKNPPKELQDMSNDNIIVTGMVDSVKEYYDRCYTVLVPIFHGGGVKIKLIEASSYNKVILSTDFGIVGSEFDDKDIVLESDETKFAEKMLDIASNPSKYDAFRNNSYLRFKNVYDQEKIMYDFESFIKNVK